MKYLATTLAVCLLTSQSVLAERSEAPAAGGEYAQTLTRIAFGSCAHQDKPQPILVKAAQAKPDLFIYLGDNIYADTEDMDIFEDKYEVLGAKPEFNTLWNATDVIATWDDHDYGGNDEGKYYTYKEESKELFLEFWREPKQSERRKHKGIYADYLYGDKGKRVQIILLDTRTFRDNLKRWWWGKKKNASGEYYRPRYVQHTDTSKTILGEQQWRWLEEQLRKPADLRIIGSSTQFGISYNGYEAWANFPHERQKLIELITATRANNVVFISGDVHYAETSKLKTDATYPLYDFTASGISKSWHFATINENRIDGPVMENNYGLLEIDWNKRSVNYKLIDLEGKIRINRPVSLEELKFN